MQKASSPVTHTYGSKSCGLLHSKPRHAVSTLEPPCWQSATRVRPYGQYCPLYLSIPLVAHTVKHSQSDEASRAKPRALRYQSIVESTDSAPHSKHSSPLSHSWICSLLIVMHPLSPVHGFRQTKQRLHRHQPWYDDEITSIRQRVCALPRGCPEDAAKLKE